jgi:hypothetical protein
MPLSSIAPLIGSTWASLRLFFFYPSRWRSWRFLSFSASSFRIEASVLSFCFCLHLFHASIVLSGALSSARSATTCATSANIIFFYAAAVFFNIIAEKVASVKHSSLKTHAFEAKEAVLCCR